MDTLRTSLELDRKKDIMDIKGSIEFIDDYDYKQMRNRGISVYDIDLSPVKLASWKHRNINSANQGLG